MFSFSIIHPRFSNTFVLWMYRISNHLSASLAKEKLIEWFFFNDSSMQIKDKLSLQKNNHSTMTRQGSTSNHNGTKAINTMEHSELCFIDPVKSGFRNERHLLEANDSTLGIFDHLLCSSPYSRQMRDYVSQHGYLYEHDAAEIMRDMISRHHTDEPDWKFKQYHRGLVSIDSIVKRDHQSFGKPFHNPSSCRTPHYNWAFGVLLYVMLCGPLWYIRFYNGLQMGVQVVSSPWFGSPGNRRKWKELEVKTKCNILQLTHSKSKMCVNACQTDIKSSRSRGPSPWSKLTKH